MQFKMQFQTRNSTPTNIPTENTANLAASLANTSLANNVKPNNMEHMKPKLVLKNNERLKTNLNDTTRQNNEKGFQNKNQCVRKNNKLYKSFITENNTLLRLMYFLISATNVHKSDSQSDSLNLSNRIGVQLTDNTYLFVKNMCK